MPKAGGSKSSRGSVGQSRLLSLPPELRNRIYELVLPTKTCLDPRGMYTMHPDHPQQPPLTQTSRQVRAETLPIYYCGLTAQCFLETETDLRRSSEWINKLGKNFGLIRCFEFQNPRECSHENYLVLQKPTRSGDFQLSLLIVDNNEDCYMTTTDFGVDDAGRLDELHQAISSGESGIIEMVKLFQDTLETREDDE